MKRASIIGAVCAVLLFLSTPTAQAVPVTFQVSLDYQATNDFATFDPLFDTVEVRGSFYDGWGSGFALVRVGSTTTYTNTFDVTDPAPGSKVEYKFHTYGVNDYWEDSLQSYIYTNSGNRMFIVPVSPLKLAPAAFNDIWGGASLLTLQVDMKAAALVGNFDPIFDTLEVRGSWDGFSSGVMLTNDPLSAISNIYAMTFSIGHPAPGGLAAYKFHIYGSHDTWEYGDNRSLIVSNVPTKQRLVFFDDLATNDLLFADTLVTFSVNMTNAVGTDFYVFDPALDGVFINGRFAGWYTWGYGAPSQYEMIRVGTSLIYTNTYFMPKGSPVALTYKYGMAQYWYGSPVADVEAFFKVNHERYIRRTGTTVLPLDTFGNQLVEPVVDSLKISPPAAGRVNVTWNGHLGIHLQTSTNLSGNTWSDLPETEIMSATNYPASNRNVFFRLIKP